MLIENYNGVQVAFEMKNNDMMINATEILKNYPNKRMSDFLSNKTTKELINQVSSETGISASELVIVVKGGQPQAQGTWMYRKIALWFALWVDIRFFSWCLNILDSFLVQLSSQGMAAKDAEINRLQNLLTAQQPAMNYYNRVLSQNNGYTTREICAQLGLRISNKKLIQMLVDGGYMFRDKSGKPYLKDPWSKQGFQATVYEPCSDGVVRPFLKWTEVGKQFILERALDWKLI